MHCIYLPLLGGAYFSQIFCFKNQSKNQKNEILVQKYTSCLIFISLLYLLFFVFPPHWPPGGSAQTPRDGFTPWEGWWASVIVFLLSMEGFLHHLAGWCTQPKGATIHPRAMSSEFIRCNFHTKFHRPLPKLKVAWPLATPPKCSGGVTSWGSFHFW